MRLHLAIRPTRIASVTLRLYPLYGQAAESQRITKLARRLFKIDDAFWVGDLVNTIDTRHTLRFDPCRDALIRRQHKLFDQSMRPSTLRPDDGLHVPIGIELNHRFRQIKIDRPSPM